MGANLEYPAEKPRRQFFEISRCVTSGTAVETEYRAGYTTITVKSTFGGIQSYADLLYNIAVKNLEQKTTA